VEDGSSGGGLNDLAENIVEVCMSFLIDSAVLFEVEILIIRPYI